MDELLMMLSSMYEDDLSDLSEKHKINSIEFLQATAKKLMQVYDLNHSCTLDVCD
jgi:hypothetical protein